LFVSITLHGQQVVFSPASVNNLRAPAYPLVTIDPYTSVWSFTDKLYDETPKHWTGTNRTFTGAARVDGKIYRFMGAEETPLIPVVNTCGYENWSGRYTFEQPSSGWEKLSFNDSQWKEGKAPFVSRAAGVSTIWITKEIWVRREFILTEDISSQDLMLQYSFNDSADIRINGIPVLLTDEKGNKDQLVPISEIVKKSLKTGKNIITAHSYNKSGIAILDFGIVRKSDLKIRFNQSAVQKSVNVLPLQTWYSFECGAVSMDLIFTSPLLANDLDLLSRPVNYLTWQAKSTDSKDHSVQVYIEVTPEWAVNTIGQSITSDRFTDDGITYLKTGTIEQPVLQKRGDDLRIDWGYLYLAGKTEKAVTMSVGDPEILKDEFIKKGRLSANIDKTLPEKMYRKMTALSMVNDMGMVGTKTASGYVMIGYDDISSITYFGENLGAYWKKGGKVNILQAFRMAADEYQPVMDKCSAFNKELMSDATAAGGSKYAGLCALAYRQSVAAHKLATGKDGELLFFSKENFSNGCIATVDVTYPSSPLYLLYNPDLLKGMLNGVFYYSESGKWTKPFAPHDLGIYPIANGQVNRENGSERLMPVEESGNMLILVTAISIMEGNADYAEKHWASLSLWADYLLKNGLDPANQLCTDDFAGFLAHNVNLSLKAIMAIAGYGKMAEMLGKTVIAAEYSAKAREMAKEWIIMAKENDHYKLAFDQAGTWSQKYNLIWNKLFRLNLFPEEVIKTEVDYYLTKQLTFGLPLDSRKTYTKSDWVMWTATLSDDPETFRKIADPIWKYVNETPGRIPISDWHETTDGKSIAMRARSVIGGYFMKMLEQKIDKLYPEKNRR
jgi:hypothetical protein